MKKWLSLLLFLSISLSLSACGIPGFQKDPPKGKDKTLSMEVLANLTYQGVPTASGKAALKDGVYSEKTADGKTIKISMWNDRAVGDLNGDHNKDSAVILITDAGDGITQDDLAVVINNKGVFEHVATTSLGANLKIKKLMIDGNLVKVTIQSQSAGASQPQQITRTFKFADNTLTELQ